MAEEIKGAVDLTCENSMAVSALATVGIYNAIEIYVMVIITFRPHRGRYFWSMVIANTGIFVHVIDSLIRYIHRSDTIVPGAFVMVAWCAMVTGQSVVLWSRLHLVVYNHTWTQLMLALVVTNACVIHLPKIVLWVLSWVRPKTGPGALDRAIRSLREDFHRRLYTAGDDSGGNICMERVLQPQPVLRVQAAFCEDDLSYLLSLFILVFLLDTMLITLEYTNNFVFQTTSKPLVYSIKLNIEFTVLNKLLAFTKMNSCGCHHLKEGPGANKKDFSTSDTIDTAKPFLFIYRNAGNGGLDIKSSFKTAWIRYPLQILWL